MAAVRCPVLMVLGSQDQMTPPKAAQTLIASASASGKTCKVIALPVGHHQMSEAPDAMLQAIREFLHP
jgi:pimeloyl-ACP methyl ester carboxylesterase